MECIQKISAWTSFALLAASPLAALAQFQPRPAQQPPAQTEPQPALRVAATVNGDAISQKEVQVNLQPQLQGREVDAQTAAKLQNQVVDRLIEGRLIEQYALEQGPNVEPQEVQSTIDRFEKQLAAQGNSFEQFALSRGHTPESFQQRIKGSLAWQKFQQQQLTNENLTRYYEQNQQQFNGQSFEDARKNVANAYVGALWQQIIGKMKPKAEIRVAPPASAVPKTPPR